jgi:hypothetical protein
MPSRRTTTLAGFVPGGTATLTRASPPETLLGWLESDFTEIAAADASEGNTTSVIIEMKKAMENERQAKPVPLVRSGEDFLVRVLPIGTH